MKRIKIQNSKFRAVVVLLLVSFIASIATVQARAVEASIKQVVETYQEDTTSSGKYVNEIIDQIQQSDSEINIQMDIPDTNAEEVLKKVKNIVNAYNEENTVKIKIKKTVFPNATHLDIRDENVTRNKNPITYIGQRATVRLYTAYHENSSLSGKVARLTPENPLTPPDYKVYVNGVRYYDEGHRPIKTIYVSPKKIIDTHIDLLPYDVRNIPVGGSDEYSYHICTKTTDLGWVHPEEFWNFDETLLITDD